MTLVTVSAPWQQVNLPALDLRRQISSGRSEGVVGTADMAVAQRGAGANMSVDIAAGEAWVLGESVALQGLYHGYNDATFNLTGFTSAHATLPRIDRVALRVRDAFHGDAANDLTFVIVTGTATSGATLSNLTGAAAVAANHLLLANVLIPAASSSITTANIDTTVRATSQPAGAPWLIDVNVFPTSIAHTNWDTIDAVSTTYANHVFGGVKQSSGAQNDEIAWDVVLAAGTWTVEVVHFKASTAGIYSVRFDGVDKGTVDGYAAAQTANARGSVSGISVASSGKVRVSLKMATKNASSSSYFGYVSHLQLRRTA